MKIQRKPKTMNIIAIESQLASIEEAIPKIKEIIADIKACNSEISKTILTSAIKKFSAPIIDFKLNPAD